MLGLSESVYDIVYLFSRLDKLRLAQEATKVAERKVVSEHDYTNILTYFNQMAELRCVVCVELNSIFLC